MLNCVDHKMLEANNTSFPHLPVLKYRIELTVGYCMQEVHSVGDYGTPPYLISGVDVTQRSGALLDFRWASSVLRRGWGWRGLLDVEGSSTTPS